MVTNAVGSLCMTITSYRQLGAGARRPFNGARATERLSHKFLDEEHRSVRSSLAKLCVQDPLAKEIAAASLSRLQAWMSEDVKDPVACDIAAATARGLGAYLLGRDFGKAAEAPEASLPKVDPNRVIQRSPRALQMVQHRVFGDTFFFPQTRQLSVEVEPSCLGSMCQANDICPLCCFVGIRSRAFSSVNVLL